MAWKQGWGRQGEDGDEGRRTAWQDGPLVQSERRRGKGMRRRRLGERSSRRGERGGGVVSQCHASWASPTG